MTRFRAYDYRSDTRPATRYDVDDVIAYARPRPMTARQKARILLEGAAAFAVLLGLIAAASVDLA